MARHTIRFVVRLLDEFDRQDEQIRGLAADGVFGPAITYDTVALRRLLGII